MVPGVHTWGATHPLVAIPPVGHPTTGSLPVATIGHPTPRPARNNAPPCPLAVGPIGHPVTGGPPDRGFVVGAVVSPVSAREQEVDVLLDGRVHRIENQASLLTFGAALRLLFKKPW